jgi:hypothetical protein
VGSEYAAADVPKSAKLAAVFAVAGPIEPGKVYGDIAQGTARVLYTPAITHPADHFSREAIGYSLDWFGKTLTGGNLSVWKQALGGALACANAFVAAAFISSEPNAAVASAHCRRFCAMEEIEGVGPVLGRATIDSMEANASFRMQLKWWVLA